jgi:hypothetical protein
MERDYEKLVLEPRGPAYVLSRTDSHGITTELVLSELNVMFLGRIDMAERLHAIEEEIALQERRVGRIHQRVLAPLK